MNGLNLLDGSAGTVNFLASIDRSATGTTTSTISVASQDLSVGNYAAKNIFTTSGTASASGDSAVMSLEAGDTTGVTLTIGGGGGTLAAGDSISIRVGDKEATYTVTDSDAASTTPNDVVAIGLKSAIEKLGVPGLAVDYDSANAGELTIKSGATATANDLAISAQFQNAGSGGLGALGAIDVSTAAGATAVRTVGRPRWSCSSISAVSDWFIPAVGSSRTSTGGEWTIALATIRRRFMPPDRVRE